MQDGACPGPARTGPDDPGHLEWSSPLEPMARLLFGLLLFATVFAQSTFIPRLNPLPVTPDLALILLFLWMSLHGVRESLLWVFIVGLVLDVLAVDPLAANGLALVPLVALAHPLRVRPWQFNATSVMLLVFLGTLVHGVILSVLRGMEPGVVVLGLQAILHVLIIPVIFFVLRLLGR